MWQLLNLRKKGEITIKKQHNSNLPVMKKEKWIELLRAICILSVIMNHTCMTIINNTGITEIGVYSYAVLDEIFMLVRFSVPCFLMISGYLLLDPNKEIAMPKLMRYIIRMFVVLLIFGTTYAVLEIVMTSKAFSFGTVLQGILNMLEGNSWLHMWYVYMLIGLYIIPPVLKAFAANTDEKTQRVILFILFVGNGIIPMINNIFDINIENYMILNIYVMYYMLGGYLRNADNFTVKREKLIYTVGIAALLVSCISELLFLLLKKEPAEWNRGASNIITPVCSLAVFVFFMNHSDVILKRPIIRKAVLSVAGCSFAMYLIHPVFINNTYKMFHISPLNFSPLILCGVLVFFIVFILISYVVSWIMKKIPFLNRII